MKPTRPKPDHPWRKQTIAKSTSEEAKERMREYKREYSRKVYERDFKATLPRKQSRAISK